MSSPVWMRSWACWDISAPWSQVKDRQSCSGRVLIVSALASRTASAPWPANAGPLADQDLRGEELLAASTGPCSRDAECSPRSQARHELTPQRTAALDVQGLVDRLVRDAHGLIIGEIDPEAVGDLLWAPGPGPAPIRSAAVASADEPHIGAWHQLAVGSGDRAGQAVLHVRLQPSVRGELGHLGAAGAPFCVPLRGRRPIGHPVTASRGVAAKLPRNRRW